MSFLPLVERELRVQSRRVSIRWIRVLAGLTATLLVALMLVWQDALRGTASVGRLLLDTPGWTLLLLVMGEGYRQGTEAFAREHREGTLGLLFLTPLSAVDVVLGKLAAQGLQLLYLLMAAMPALAIALPAGGVTAGEFWREQGVLLLTAVWALAAGLWTGVRPAAQTVRWRGGVLVLALLIGPPLAESLDWGGVPALSPGQAFVRAEAGAYATSPGAFLKSIGGMVGVAVCLLAATAFHLRQTRFAGANPVPVRGSDSGTVFGPCVIPTGLHAALGGRSQPRWDGPDVVWWDARLRAGRIWVWLAFVGTSLLGLLPWVISRLFRGGVVSEFFWATSMVEPLLRTALLATAAARGITEARVGGLLELILGTPWSARRLAKDYLRALRRLWLLPLVTAALVSCLALGVELSNLGPMPGYLLPYLLVMRVAYLASEWLLAVAACVLAAWLSLRDGRPGWVIGWTVVWVNVIPRLFQMLVSVVFRVIGLTGAIDQWNLLDFMMWWLPYLVVGGYAMGLLVKSRQQFLNGFGEGLRRGKTGG